MPQPSLLHTAISAALEAGKAILNIYHSENFEVEIKADNSPLTKADIASHNIIMSHLSATNIPVLSEEGKSIPYNIRKDWKQLWIVDPIDGTKEFIKRNGEFTVNIALIENQTPVLGVIFVPVSGDLYFSISISISTSISNSNSTSGSFKVKVDLNNFDVETLINKAIKLPIEREDKTFTIVSSRSHGSGETEAYINDMRKKHGHINLIIKGSSLKFCMVAEGQADCYPKLGPTMEWDTAAGQAICEQAGVEVVDWMTKKSLNYNKEDLWNGYFMVRKNI
ncbi:MAG: 3'(2'),5'-bisphosphate nucleotidase CysQ [Gelidibacter sp.]